MRNLLIAYVEAFRIWMRRRTTPLSVEEANVKRFFWAKVYALTTFGVLSYFTYRLTKSGKDFSFRNDLPKNIATAVTLEKNEEVRFISFKGFQKVEDFTYTAEELKALAESKPSSNSVIEDSKDSITV